MGKSNPDPTKEIYLATAATQRNFPAVAWDAIAPLQPPSINFSIKKCPRKRESTVVWINLTALAGKIAPHVAFATTQMLESLLL